MVRSGSNMNSMNTTMRSNYTVNTMKEIYKELDMSPNMSYLCWFMFVMMIPGYLIGYGIGYAN